MHLSDLDIPGTEKTYYFKVPEVRERRGSLVKTGKRVILMVHTTLRHGIPQLGGSKKVRAVSDLTVESTTTAGGRQRLAAEKISKNRKVLKMALDSYHQRVLERRANSELRPQCY